MNPTWLFVIGLVIGLGVGFVCGEVTESKLWMDALRGRERIIHGDKDRP